MPRASASGAATGVLCLSFVALMASPACRGTNRAEQELFLEGRSLVAQGRYERAIPLLDRCLAEYPLGGYASRAGLFLGKARLGLDDLHGAARAFERTAGTHPESLEGHKSLYKLALIALLRGDPDEALRRFDELANAADGPLVPEATAMRRYIRASGQARH